MPYIDLEETSHAKRGSGRFDVVRLEKICEGPWDGEVIKSD
jgi:hypothetical protein